MPDYKTILEDAFIQLGRAGGKRRDLEVECAKLRQFILATLNMLPDDERKSFQDRLKLLFQEDDIRTNSLTDAIRRALQSAPGQWHTAAQMRDRLIGGGFNFGGYTANPLASVSTTLKRLKPDEAETAEIEGVTAYKWKRRRIVFRKRETSKNLFGSAPVTEKT